MVTGKYPLGVVDTPRFDTNVLRGGVAIKVRGKGNSLSESDYNAIIYAVNSNELSIAKSGNSQIKTEVICLKDILNGSVHIKVLG